MKYLSKGELLTTLGSDADEFTAFMLDPSAFGATEPMVSTLKVAKQKLDWTNTIDLGLPEIAGLIQVMLAYSVISQSTADAIANTPDRKDGDMYRITVKAQDVITVENIYGAIEDNTGWILKIDFINETKNEIIAVEECFDVTPTEDRINKFISDKIKQLKSEE